MYNSTYGGIVNSAFAKIPITATPLGEFNDSRNKFLQNVTTFDVPEEKVSKLVFIFRYHDGRLVDFGNNRFNFTIEFNCLKNEIARSYNVRVPLAYTLKIYVFGLNGKYTTSTRTLNVSKIQKAFKIY